MIATRTTSPPDCSTGLDLEAAGDLLSVPPGPQSWGTIRNAEGQSPFARLWGNHVGAILEDALLEGRDLLSLSQRETSSTNCDVVI
jgi:hypothetical protein